MIRRLLKRQDVQVGLAQGYGLVGADQDRVDRITDRYHINPLFLLNDRLGPVVGKTTQAVLRVLQRLLSLIIDVKYSCVSGHIRYRFFFYGTEDSLFSSLFEPLGRRIGSRASYRGTG
jgi:hypothetical protein